MYVGAIPTTGDFKLLDSITTSSATTFNLRQGGVAVYPQSANHCLVVLNGVLQTAGSSFNIVNDTVVFSESLSSSDVINQILVLGNVNDIGVPSDDTVSQAKIQSEAINESKMQISNAGSNGQFLSKQSGNTGGLTWAAAGGDLSFGGDTFGADKTIGSNDAYALSFETNNAVGLKIDTNGHVTKPLQPAFLAYVGSTENNLASEDAVPFSNEVFDNNADFNTSTYTFTAPVTGKYFISFSCRLDNVDTASSYVRLRCNTSNGQRGGAHSIFDPGTLSGDAQYWGMGDHILCDMDANDTAIIRFVYNSGAQQVDIPGSSTEQTHFSAFLVC